MRMQQPIVDAFKVKSMPTLNDSMFYKKNLLITYIFLFPLCHFYACQGKAFRWKSLPPEKDYITPMHP